MSEPNKYNPEPAFDAFLKKENYSIRDLDLDAFADGIVAHRQGKEFHENPDGHAPTMRRLSWSIGWNERALKTR